MPSGKRGPRRLSWAQVSHRRLARQGLTAPLADAGPADAAAAMCGTHAQVQSAAELSIGLRLADATQTDVRTALWTERSLVKTFGPRGTVHLLPSRDLPMWCGRAVRDAAAAVAVQGRRADDRRSRPRTWWRRSLTRCSTPS